MIFVNFYLLLGGGKEIIIIQNDYIVSEDYIVFENRRLKIEINEM